MDERDVRLVKAISDLGTSPEAFFTMGETDFVVIAHLSSSDTVERLISEFEAIDGVERANSTFTIATLLDESRAPATYELDTLIEELTE